MSSRFAALAALTLAGSLLAGTAFAATEYTLTGGTNFTSGDLTGSVEYSGNPSENDSSVYIGPLNMAITTLPSGPTIQQTVYCSDIFNEFVGGQTYTLGSSTLAAQIQGYLTNNSDPNAAADATTKVNQIGALLNNAQPTDNAAGAAIQAAIWIIEDENGTTGYGNGGSFPMDVTVTSNQAEFSSDLAIDLADASNGTWSIGTNNSVWEYDPVNVGTNQNFSYLGNSSTGHEVPPVPAPEPATLGLLGVSVLGLGLARRKRTSNPAS